MGSEEGSWLYGAYRWATAPVLSVGISGLYQSLAVRHALSPTASQSFTDQKLGSADVYVNVPTGRDAEVVVEATGYLSRNRTASADTGKGFFADLGYRWRGVAPYVSFEYFAADDCAPTSPPSACVRDRSGQPHAADSRNAKVGANFFFNKNYNHVNVELGINHGQSAYGPQSITTATAGYVPKGINTLLSTPAQRSVLVHCNVLAARPSCSSRKRRRSRSERRRDVGLHQRLLPGLSRNGHRLSARANRLIGGAARRPRRRGSARRSVPPT